MCAIAILKLKLNLCNRAYFLNSAQAVILWAIACLFIPPVVLVFTVMHWDVAKKPFLIQLTGLGIMLIGAS
jgi:membrane protein YdbS with pleckstrin-like domain